MKNPVVVPIVTAMATHGDMNIEMKMATWLAKVYDMGPITTRGKVRGIRIPMAISRAVEVSLNRFCFVIFCSFSAFFVGEVGWWNHPLNAHFSTQKPPGATESS